MTEGRGQVVTFYSYKGGVGRSFLLANCAALLARWGARVLCVDWDFEAPGLPLYFGTEPISRYGGDASESAPGLIDWVLDGDSSEALDWRSCVRPVSLAVAGASAKPAVVAEGILDLLPSGSSAHPSYGERLGRVDWARLYEEEGLGLRLEALRGEWVATYDWVFIDSRTGLSDIGGICTAQLPDSLVLVVAPNQQSLDGGLRAVHRAAIARESLPIDRGKLRVLPVLSRLDARDEYERAQEWLVTAANAAEAFYADWRHGDLEARELIEVLRIPYHTYWSFGEQLPVLFESISDADNISYWLANVACFVAEEFGQSERLIRSREDYVTGVRERLAKVAQRRREASAGSSKEPSERPPPARVFISSTRIDNEERRRIVEDAVLRAGMLPVAMERFTASAQPTVEECMRLVAESDVFLGIVGRRYGWVPPGQRRSISELEYDEAGTRGLARLMFVVDETAPFSQDELDPGPDRWKKQERLEAFVERVHNETLAVRFEDDMLGASVLQALHAWQRQPGGVNRSTQEKPVAEEPSFDERRTGYRTKLAAQHATLSMAGFSNAVRAPIRLDELYVPLRASVDVGSTARIGFADAEQASEWLRERDEAREIPLADAFRAAAHEGRRGIVILGDPGSGKTTHLKRIVLALDEEGAESLGLPEQTIPLLLPLRNLRSHGGDFHAWLRAEIESVFLSVEPDFSRRLLEHRPLVFLLDGLDEVSDEAERVRVAEWVTSTHQANPDCWFVVTSRYAGYGQSAMLAPFLELHLQPLDRAASEQFIRNWYGIVEASFASEPSERAQAEQRAAQAARGLIGLLSSAEFRAARVSALTRNPLLLTTLCLVHRDRGGALPNQRHKLYEACVEILLERWRQAKRLPLSVPGDQAKRVLQPVALWLHREDGRTRATAAELADTIEPALSQLRANMPSAERFLRSIRDESGLLTGYSGNLYGFMHLGFQEYLAAREIRRHALEGDQEPLRSLAAAFGESWWQEVLLLFVAQGDPSLFEPLLARIVAEPAFGRHRELLDLLLEEASEVTGAPFAACVREDPGHDQELWRRQREALYALERIEPDTAASVALDLSTHPYAPIREWCRAQLGEDQREVSRSERGEVELVLVPGGRFAMGSPPDEVGRREAEGPQHWVAVTDFWIGRFAVTNEEYARFLQANPSYPEPRYWNDRRFNGARQPVVGVSWKEARDFAAWAGCRLPTESEWEYACRAGTTTPYSFGREISRDEAHFDLGGDGRPATVGSLPANAWGLHEMHGNVWEWVEDDWHDGYEGAPEDGLAWVGNPRGALRVVRGGSWYGSAGIVRAAYRGRYEPEIRSGVSRLPACPRSE